MNNAEGCGFCRSQSLRGSPVALLPCVFCAGERLRLMRQQTANFALRRMGFAARESFDLHCAALKAAINNKDSGKVADDDDDAKAGGGKVDDDNGATSCGRRFAAMAAAFFGDGVNAIGREEFDAHCQILAAAEARMKKDNAKTAKTTKAKSGGGKSAKDKGE